jgi:hypothetical protein
MTTMATTQTPTLAEALNIYCKLAIGPFVENSESKERCVRNFVVNLQLDGDSRQ